MNLQSMLQKADIDLAGLCEAFDCMPIGVMGVGTDYGIMLWNRCLERWTRVMRFEIIGRNLLEYYPHLNHQKYVSRLEGVFAGGPPVVFSSQLHRYIVPCLLNNGKKRIQHTTVSAVRLGNGKFMALFFIQDVTELTKLINRNKAYSSARNEMSMRQKKLEARALALEGKSTALLEASFDPVLIVEKSSGRIVEANQAARELYGLAGDLGENLRYVSDISCDPERTMTLLSGGDVFISQDRHINAAGETFALSFKAYQFHNQSSLLLAVNIKPAPAGAA